jgi:hypothetical protein
VNFSHIPKFGILGCDTRQHRRQWPSIPAAPGSEVEPGQQLRLDHGARERFGAEAGSDAHYWGHSRAAHAGGEEPAAGAWAEGRWSCCRGRWASRIGGRAHGCSAHVERGLERATVREAAVASGGSHVMQAGGSTAQGRRRHWGGPMPVARRSVLRGDRASRGEWAHGSESAQMSYSFGRGEDKGDGEHGHTWTAGGNGRPTALTRGGGRWLSHRGIATHAWVRAGRDAWPWAVVGRWQAGPTT